MPVQWKTVDLPLGSGMDDNTAKAALPLGRPQLTYNIQHTVEGAYSRRGGFSTLMNPTPIPGTPFGLGSALQYNNTPLAAVNKKLYSYSGAIGGWVDRGALRSVPTSTQVTRSKNKDLIAADSFTINQLTITAWTDGTKIDAQITDEYNGSVVSTLSDLFPGASGGQVPGCVAVQNAGNTYFFVYFGATFRRAVKLSGSQTIVWDVASFSIFGGGGTCYASRVIPNVSPSLGTLLFAGIFSGFGGSLITANIDPTGTGVVNWATVNGAFPHASRGPLALNTITGAFSNCFYVGYINTDNTLHGISYLVGNNTGGGGACGVDTQIDTLEPKHVTILDNHDGNGSFIYDVLSTYGTTASMVKTCVKDFIGVAISGPTVLMRSVSLASSAAYFVDRGYFAVLYYSKVTGSVSPVIGSKFPALATSSATLNSALFVIDYNANVIARVFRASAMTMPNTPVLSTDGSSTLYFSGRVLSQAESATIQSALALGGVGKVKLDMYNDRARGINAFRDFLTIGGSPCSFDGVSAVEANFHIYPEAVATKGADTKGAFQLSNQARNTTYNVGDLVKGPLVAGTIGHVYLCVQSGKTAAIAPAFPVNGATGTDGTVIWQEIGLDSPVYWHSPWTPTAGMTVIPSTGPNGFNYVIVAAAGAVGAEPVWPTVIGTTVTVGAHTYLCAAAWDYLTDNTGYTYAFCYAWVDANGQLQRSAMSIPTAVQLPQAETTTYFTTGGNAIYACTTARISSKLDSRIEVYRTKGDGTVLQQIANMVNNPAVDAIGFVDTTPDSTQQLGGVVYQGPLGAGEFPNRPPPSCTALADFGQRVVCNSLENPYTLYFSKLVVEGFGAAWADELTIQLNGGFGPVMGLMEMDGNLIVFQRDAVSLLAGAGPDNTGAGVGFGDAIQLATDVGCTNTASIVLTAKGILFQSLKGVYMLRRDRTTWFAGEPIQKDFVGAVAVASDPNWHQVFFLSDDLSTIYVYDYEQSEEGAWGIWTVNPDGEGVLGISAGQSSLFIVTDSGNGWMRNDNASYDGAGTHYQWQVIMAPVRLDGVQGYARARGANLKFDSDGGGAITVSVLENDANVGDPGQYSLTPVTLAPGMDSFQCRFHKQKLESIGLIITETTPTSGTGRLILEGIGFEIGVEGGLRRLVPNKRAH